MEFDDNDGDPRGRCRSDSAPDTSPVAASPGLSYWSEATDRLKEPRRDAVALMLAQPRFADACRASLGRSLARHGRNKLLTRVTRDISRLIYAYLVVYLDARSGITLKAIQELTNALNVASPGRAQAILLHLRAIGYIRPDPTSGDRRSHRYVPSPEMQENLREVIADELQAFSLIEPEAAVAADLLAEPAFFRAFMIRFGDGIITALQNKPSRAISLFAERNAGLVILWDIFLSAQEDASYPPRTTLKMSVTELAQKYGVSRSHVFRLLRDAENLGFLNRNADDQTGTITDELANDVADFHVVVFMGFAMCCQYAFEATSMARAG